MRQADRPGSSSRHAPGPSLPRLQDHGRKDSTLTRVRSVFILSAVLVLIADIATKHVIASTFYLHEVRQVVGDYVRLTYIHNPGAAFGLFPGSRPALIVISVAAVLVVVTVAWNRRSRLGTVVPLGLILGGAVGNLIDRIRLGEVVDFIQVGFPPDTYWPVFNVADSAVTVGVIWLALGLVSSREGEEAGEETDEEGLEPKEGKLAGVDPPGPAG